VPDAGDLTLRGLVRALSSAGPDAIDVTCGVIDLSAGGTWPLAQAPLVGTGILLTIGAATMQPVVADDRIQIRPIARLSLAYDARYIDQAMAVGFLESVAQRLRTWVG
jgi:pyruvate/2-oxoglutarate dehydrogenase complex dihydrolipoamide acyltransferase (E2) component